MKSSKNMDKILKISLLVLGVVVIFSFGLNSAAAASNTTIITTNQSINIINQTVTTNNSSSVNNSNTEPDPTIKRTGKGYATIQDAVNAATNGDTILLDPGTYTGTGNYKILINKNLIITSQSQTNTIIDAQGQGYIFNIQKGVTVTIEDLTLINGNNIGSGGAI
ncbi:MAG: hypothetical protein ACLPWD_00080, partial [Methanobacterium sp.]